MKYSLINPRAVLKNNELLSCIFGRLSVFLSSNKFGIYFSLAYATILVFSFYPGLLYSDSVNRWNLAIEYYNNGIENFPNYSSHHPVLPSIIQSYFYGLTKEIGFFIFFQAFMFSYSIFLLVREISAGKYVNVLSVIFLLAPLNVVYSVFHSFDSLYAVINIFLVYFLIRFYKKSSLIGFFSIAISIFLLVSVRLNSVLLAPLIVFFHCYICFYRKERRRNYFLGGAAIILFACAPFFITSSLNMRASNSWVLGFAWEYANLATKSKNLEHSEFISSLGGSPEDIRNNICYHGIWCGSERAQFDVAGSNELSVKTFKEYLKIAITEPKLFIVEKSKYIASLMGVGEPLSNAEIGKWRTGDWAEQFKKFGFYTNENKEKLVDEYFFFSDIVSIVFQPYKLLIVGVIVLALLGAMNRAAFYFVSVGFSVSWLYYVTFFITSQNHEFRYFYPVFFYTQVMLIVFFSEVFFKIERCIFVWRLVLDRKRNS
ncbi:hypothetical protein [Pseudomonas shahriarae]|uniref:hypothetical protein n=1 Tax=Pseudomonas shahriarae TaxID=2745512 RepID=UPI00236052EA|nr:hypothetical protein [Pseudomonas shahriarae]MDD0982917.1 hypothetical protein [Pseudomonas shahriarae]